MTSQKIHYSHDVKFDENCFPYKTGKNPDNCVQTVEPLVKVTLLDEDEDFDDNIPNHPAPIPTNTGDLDNDLVESETQHETEVTPLSEDINKDTPSTIPHRSTVSKNPGPDPQVRTSSRLRDKTVSYRGM